MKRTVVGLLVAGLTVVGAGTAHADEPAPITISPDQVKKICEQRVPRVEERVKGLTDRINGGPEVFGSVQNLRKRAAEADNPEQVKRLNERADRREGHLDRLKKAGERVAKFKQNHCGYAGTK